MQRQTDRKILLIQRRTRLEELIVRHNTVEQARFYLEHLGGDFADYLREDQTYREAIRKAVEALEPLGIVQRVMREYVPNFLFGAKDVVVVVGQDGLVANTLKYLDGQPLIGVNPDPARWDGVLLPFRVGELRAVVSDALAGRRPVREVTMAKASLSDHQVLYAVNDLFIGQRTHVSSRYRIQAGGAAEDQSSSGIIVSTGLGASGWLKSVYAGAYGVVGAMGGSPPAAPGAIRWEEDALRFSVREPFPTRTTGAKIVYGRIAAGSPMTVMSYMPENGVIFSDGMESDALEFRSGVTASVDVAEKKGRLIV